MFLKVSTSQICQSEKLLVSIQKNTNINFSSRLILPASATDTVEVITDDQAVFGNHMRRYAFYSLTYWSFSRPNPGIPCDKNKKFNDKQSEIFFTVSLYSTGLNFS